jgi:carboxypeptidase Q
MLSPTVGCCGQPELAMVSLGGSVGTNGVPITATTVVVSDWAELVARRAEVPGRIVIYAVEWEGYTKTQGYRSLGATVAAKFGAVATLMRSAGPFSINSPHTGSMSYLQVSTPDKTISSASALDKTIS